MKKMRSIDSLKFDPRNARKHDERNIKAVMDSLSRVGQRKPVVIYSDMIIAGNGTVEAAKRLGWTEVWVNDDSFKSFDDAKAYAIMDNRSAELAVWDDAVLSEILTELEGVGIDLDEIGFNEGELNALKNPVSVDDVNDDDKGSPDEKLVITVSFDNSADLEDLFIELRDRGFKVKI